MNRTKKSGSLLLAFGNIYSLFQKSNDFPNETLYSLEHRVIIKLYQEFASQRILFPLLCMITNFTNNQSVER